MKKIDPTIWQDKPLYVGIDIHRKRWHISIRSADGQVLFSQSIEGRWPALKHRLEKYPGAQFMAVYEAGYFGFWLYDELTAYGVTTCVTPPSLIPSASGNKVKTDRLDSDRLAQLLQAGLLTSVHVPTEEERAHRQVVRRRRQFIQDRIRVKNRIKAELRLYGLELSGETKGPWTQRLMTQLRAVRFADEFHQTSFVALLAHHDFLSAQIDHLAQQLKTLAESETYRERVEILISIPGLGWLSAMEILLELQDVARFQRAEQLAAYVGLTPGQHSSGEHVRLGRITRQGKSTVRTLLVLASWRLIDKDGAMREKYERIKARAGGKRAIVAIARTLLVRLRRILLNREPYALGLVSG